MKNQINVIRTHEVKSRIDEQEHLKRASTGQEGEPEVCKVFGCGRRLTLREKLHDDRCVHHQHKKRHNIADPKT